MQQLPQWTVSCPLNSPWQCVYLHEWIWRWIGAIAIALLAIWLNLTEPVLASTQSSVTSCVNLAWETDQPKCDRASADFSVGSIIAQVSDTTPQTPSTPKQRIADSIARLPLESPIGLFNLFIIFFVTLGLLKIIPPFVQLTQNADQALRRQLALRSAAISTVVIVLVVIIGQNILAASFGN